MSLEIKDMSTEELTNELAYWQIKVTYQLSNNLYFAELRQSEPN